MFDGVSARDKSFNSINACSLFCKCSKLTLGSDKPKEIVSKLKHYCSRYNSEVIGIQAWLYLEKERQI